MTIKTVLLLLFVIVLCSACGGGGGSNELRNIAPIANFISSIDVDTDPLTVNFDANNSSDSDGTIASYLWDFGDGSSSTATALSHTYSTTGSYTVRLTVIDNGGLTHSINRSIEITSNAVAQLTLNGANNGAIPHALTFDGSSSQVLGSTNGQPAIVSYQWDFGDGNTDSGAVVNHTYTTLGSYNAVLTVTDSSGDTDTATTTIKTAFTVSGTISSATGSVVDIDVNDPSRQDKNNPNTVFQTNNVSVNAQPLPNPAMINGFISAIGSGPPPFGSSNFSTETDNDDYYSAHLLAGQFVSLRVADFDITDPGENDIDLQLYDSNLALVAFSHSNAEFESIGVTTSGDYFIRVHATSGFSKYTMNIGTTSFVTGAKAYGNSADFITGEAIVKMKPANQLSAQFVQPTSAINLSHNDNTRVALSRFSVAKSLATQSTNNTRNNATTNFTILNNKNYAKLKTLDYIKQLNQRTDLEYAEVNFRVYSQRVPNDTLYFLQAHYPQINLPQAWDITTGTPTTGSVVVAVIDTGVVLNHEDLVGQLVDSNDDYDFIRSTSSSIDGDGIDPNPDDPGDGSSSSPSSWHGTHVAGTIAAASNNNQGVTGVSWGAKIMPIRVLGLDGGSSYDVNQGVRFAAGLSNDSGTVPSKRADIINLSLGGNGFSQASQALYNQVRSTGAIVIAAAGNESSSTPSYPASYNHVISVSAIDLTNNLAPYSNSGTMIDVAAPGGNLSIDRNADGYGDGILSTLIDPSGGIRNPSYQFYQGTSMAAPHVAGVAALMKAVHPALTPNEFDSSLQNGLLTNDIGDTGRDNSFGFGVIDALKAVQQAQLLAGGSATGSILASPNRVDFGTVLTSRSLTLSQVGNTPPSVTNISKNASWLTIDSTGTAANGSGAYALAANRSGLTDATYTDNITFTLDNGRNLNVPVTLQVQSTVNTSADAGFLFVLLLDADTLNFVAQVEVDVSEGKYEFSFTDIPFGEYVIIAGSDVDNDFFICSVGESCGRYPTNDQPLRITVNDDMSNLNFLASFVSDAIVGAQTGSQPLTGIARKAVNNQAVENKEIMKSVDTTR